MRHPGAAWKHRASFDDLPVDVLLSIVQNVPLETLFRATMTSRCLRIACTLHKAEVARKHWATEHFLPRVSGTPRLLSLSTIVASTLRNTVMCGAGVAMLKSVKSVIRMGKGHTHCTGVIFGHPLEIIGDVTLVGCRVEAGVHVTSGGTLRLVSCLVLCSSDSRCKVAKRTSLVASKCTFRASSPSPKDAVAFHLVATSCASLTLDECSFEGMCSTCVYVSTCCKAAMARLVVRSCTFHGGMPEHRGRGGLTLRINGPLPRVLDFAHNRWLARNLAITSATAAPELATPVHPSSLTNLSTVRCVANEFSNAALYATGTKVWLLGRTAHCVGSSFRTAW